MPFRHRGLIEGDRLYPRKFARPVLALEQGERILHRHGIRTARTGLRRQAVGIGAVAHREQIAIVSQRSQIVELVDELPAVALGRLQITAVREPRGGSRLAVAASTALPRKPWK